MLCHAPSMGSCSQFCLILHPHRVAVLFPPTFASPWRNSFLQIHGEQLCSRQNLGPPLKNDTKTTKIWGWGHLMVQINPPPGCLRFPMKMGMAFQSCGKAQGAMASNSDTRENSWPYGQCRGGWDEVGYGAVCDMRDITQCTERMVVCCR